MNALIWFVILYWVISVGIGIYAARYVNNSKDFAVAGRSLPMYIVTATVFATWFGSEAILGISATFLKEGMRGIISDPFGASMCLVLVGMFFARRLYRMNLITIGDFYRNRFGRKAEIITTLCIVVSYLGWVAAQIKALGLVFFVLSIGAISVEAGILIGAASILIYTLMGGMWAVAITDFLQMIIVIAGMLYIGWEVSGMVGGAGVVIQHASDAGKFANFWPAFDLKDMMWFVAAWITMMFGSIPQQDVFQRIASSKSEKVARNASILGGVLYFIFAFVPIFLAYSATLIDPAMVDDLMEKDSQLILPTLIMTKMPMFAQVMFFGALLSAIKSCASATLLAPSVTFSENILRGLLPNQSDKQALFTMRAVVLVFTCFITWFALTTESSIHHMVENASKVTLVSAFVPLVAGLFWKRAASRGALASMILGITSWVLLEVFSGSDGFWPPQLVGMMVSLVAMVVVSLLTKPTQPAPKPATV